MKPKQPDRTPREHQRDLRQTVPIDDFGSELFVVRKLDALTRKLREGFTELAAEHIENYCPSFGSPLLYLGHQGPSSVTAIAGAIGVSHVQVVKALAAMRAAGLVRTRPDREDARIQVQRLTTAGQAAFQVLCKLAALWGELLAELRTETGMDLDRAVDAHLGALRQRSIQHRISSSKR